MPFLKQDLNASREGLQDIREEYPNTFVRSEADQINREANLSTKKIETNGIYCRQCNFPIKDRRKVTTCPNCKSDNFEGRPVTL